MFCSNCGKEIENNVNFCPWCGGKISPIIQHTKDMTPPTIELWIGNG